MVRFSCAARALKLIKYITSATFQNNPFSYRWGLGPPDDRRVSQLCPDQTQSASWNCQTIWDYRSNICHSTIGGVSAEQHCQRRESVSHRADTIPPPAQSVTSLGTKAVVRKQGSDTPHRQQVAADRRRSTERDVKVSEDATAGAPTEPARRRPRRLAMTRRATTPRRCVLEPAALTPQRRVASTAQSGEDHIWCSLCRAEVRTHRAVVVFVWVIAPVRAHVSTEGGVVG